MRPNIPSRLAAALCATAIFAAFSTHAAVVITPVYDTSFTLNPNFAALRATVNSALSTYSSRLGNNLTLPINFTLSTTVVGAQSAYATTDISYTTYRGALSGSATTAKDATAVANLGAGANDPFTNSANVSLPTALALALSLGGIQASYGTVTFNQATYESNPAGFLGVIQHEVNEVLGTASNLPNANPPGTAGTLPATIAAADLFRYATGATRSFNLNATSDPNNKAFFRLSAGGPNLQEYNNLPNGGDYGDWAANGSFAPAPQDWTGPSSVFTSMDVSTAELDLLDVIGYALVPEPGTATMLASVALGWLAVRRNRRGKQALRF